MLLGSLLAGVSGAVLIAVLVVGRGGQAEGLTWETLDEEGGVLWMRIEQFERVPFGGIGPAREGQVQETWTRFERGTAPTVMSVVHSLDGTLHGRTRLTRDDDSGEQVAESELGLEVEGREWPRPRGHGIGQGDSSCPGFWPGSARQVAGIRQGTTMCIEPYVRPTNDGRPIGYYPMWPNDLDVASIQKETWFDARGGLESILFRALLEDGSRVVIGAQRFHLSVLPLSEWEGIEELAWGD